VRVREPDLLGVERADEELALGAGGVRGQSPGVSRSAGRVSPLLPVNRAGRAFTV